MGRALEGSDGSSIYSVDGRSALARRYRDILAQLVSDSRGRPVRGADIIARRATTLAVWCEQAEAKAYVPHPAF